MKAVAEGCRLCFVRLRGTLLEPIGMKAEDLVAQEKTQRLAPCFCVMMFDSQNRRPAQGTPLPGEQPVPQVTLVL